jgi:transglutaminase-like putative cysteine protease
MPGAGYRVPGRIGADPHRCEAGAATEQAPGRPVLPVHDPHYRGRMLLSASDPDAYLASDAVLDFRHPAVAALAEALRRDHPGETAFASAAFEYVRDEVGHCLDVQDPRVTLSASDTLREGVGLCFSKTHLLAALLRARGIPAGLCYQRLTDDGTVFTLHGLIAVHLGGTWHRQDPRGNKPGVDAQFSLSREQLAWQVRPALGECDYPDVLVRPHPAVVAALTEATDMLDLCREGLPAEI